MLTAPGLGIMPRRRFWSFRVWSSSRGQVGDVQPCAVWTVGAKFNRQAILFDNPCGGVQPVACSTASGLGPKYVKGPTTYDVCRRTRADARPSSVASAGRHDSGRRFQRRARAGRSDRRLGAARAAVLPASRAAAVMSSTESTHEQPSGFPQVG